MTLSRIRIELGRSSGFPNGSPAHGYEFVAPLDNDGFVDVDAWRSEKDKCTVLRFWGEDPQEVGKLRHLGHGWRFDYDSHVSTDDEPFFKLDRHKIVPGGYVSVTEHDGLQRPFKIVDVSPA